MKLNLRNESIYESKLSVTLAVSDHAQDSENVIVAATIDVLGMEVPVPNLEPDLCLKALQCPVRRVSIFRGRGGVRVEPSIEC